MRDRSNPTLGLDAVVVTLVNVARVLGPRITLRFVNAQLTRVCLDDEPIGPLYPGYLVSMEDLAGSTITRGQFESLAELERLQP